VHSSDDLARHLDEEQMTLGEGPGNDAVRHGTPVFADDLARHEFAQRWPVFAARAMDSGVHAAFAFPLRIGVINLGVLSLYRQAAGPLDDDEISKALRLAQAAAYAMLDLFADGSVEGVNGSRRDARWSYADDLDLHRVEVHQASGMLMVQLNVPIEEALARMRAYSFGEGIPLGEVARAVVARSLRLGDDGIEDGQE
jgi:hypothetical protein